MAIGSLVSAGLKTLTSGIGLAETILKRKTPSEARKLGELKIELIETVRQREDESVKLDPNDELIQKLYKDEDYLHEKIDVYMDLAASQQSSISS